MTNNPEPESTRAAIVQQGVNPVETGLLLSQVAELTGQASHQWKERDQIPVLLLRALCRLTARRSGEADAGFSPVELQQEVEKERPGWARGDKEAIAKSVRNAWKKLEVMFQHKLDHLGQAAAAAGIDAVQALDKREGGGAGNPTRYRLVLSEKAPLPQSSAAASPVSADIEYICEDSDSANWIAAMFVRGIQMDGARRAAFIGGMVVLLLFFLLCGLFVLLLFTQSSFDALTFKAMLATGTIAGFIWFQFVPLYRVVFVRITKAPWWLQSWDDDRFLEWRRPPRYPDRSLHAVRYSGTCPLCEGRVVVRPRRWWSEDEIVGRCEEAPTAHVFSFDHVLRVGRRLQS